MRHTKRFLQQAVVWASLLSAVGYATAAVAEEGRDEAYAPLPTAASSFGAVESDGWLYVYGGHIAPVHQYSTEAVSHQFWRLRLEDGKTWEELPGGPGVQGMNLATHDGKIYRVGGMEPRNKPGDPTDNHSRSDCVRFDPATRQWQELPALPQSRSSHDVVVLGGKLYVIGGWSMHGDDGEDWLSKMLVLDLQAAQPTWQEIEQPFQRRALIAAVHKNRIYVLGGFDEENHPHRRVDIYDPATNKWSLGPEIPGQDHNGFAPAACSHQDELYVSVADGTLYRLDEAQGAWTEVVKLQPRIVHRLAPFKSQILMIGGARGGGNLSSIEVVDVSPAAKNAQRTSTGKDDQGGL